MSYTSLSCLIGRQSVRALLKFAVLGVSILYCVTLAAAGDAATADVRAGSERAASLASDPSGVPPVLVSAKTRRIHGSIPSPFDLPLSLDTAAPTTEPRLGPNTTIVFTFDKPVTAAVATILEGIATLGTMTFNGSDVIVDLTGVNDIQYVAVGLTNVDAMDGGSGGSGMVRIGFLTGDVNQNNVVTVSDLGLVNAQLAQPVTNANYLKDINASGTLTVADKGIANSKLTRALPPAVCTPPTGAGTLHGSLVPGDTWTAAGNPHIITFDVSLLSGTLTLQPCVVVRVREGFNIRIGNLAGGAAASIVALGSQFTPIVFESEDPTKYWGSLRIFPTGQATLESVTLRHAGNAATAQNFGGALQVLGDSVALTRTAHVKNVRIETSATFGLNVQFFGGLTADSSGLTIIDSGRTPGSIAIDTSYPIFVTTPSVQTLPPGQYTGNQKDAILVSNPGTFATDETFRNLGVPYRMNTSYAQSPTLSAAVGGLATLTIEAGVTIRLLKTVGNNWAFSLGTSGGDLPANIFPVRLIANGTAAQPIVFTSDAAVPAPGDWGGIFWRGGPATGNVVNFVRVEYAGADSGTSSFGCGPADNDAALIFTNWIPGEDFVQNSTFSNSAAGGIVMGWISDSVRDFKTGNTFTGIGNGCAVARWKNKTLPACPSPPPVCL